MTAYRSTTESWPKSTSPSLRSEFTWWPHGPISSRWPDRPAAVIAAKFAGVAISSSSYHPEMCSTGTSTSAMRCW